MSNVSTVTPACLIDSARTAASAAASSTASPNFPTTVTTWQLPGRPSQPLVQSSQSFSTQQGQVFTDFASSGTIVPMPNQLPAGQSTFPLVAGTPKNND